MLQNADGLPASESEVPEDYPLRISWPGILVDDEGHPEDIITRVREALAVIWKDNASSIEQEACGILKVRSLRDYFAEKKSGGKFNITSSATARAAGKHRLLASLHRV